jgi:hypothetical protein
MSARDRQFQQAATYSHIETFGDDSPAAAFFSSSFRIQRWLFAHEQMTVIHGVWHGTCEDAKAFK